MTDLKNPVLIVAKGFAFLLLAALAGALLWLQLPTWRTAALVVCVAWASARFYFFAFHVLERWVAPGVPCRGLVDLLTWRRRARALRKAPSP